MGVIEPVSHSKWASPIVVIKKKETGKIRACGDFKVSGLNKALLEEYHPLPTSEDIFGTLKGSVFSQIDLRDAYLQVELDEESQKVVVINTHKGLFKYKRMAFGLKTAPAIFQKIVDKMIAGIPGVAAYLDDVIVSAESHEEHEKTLTKLFQRLQEYGFRIEKEALALVYTVKKCHKFIFGRRFTLHTDHRPLLALFGSNKDLPVHAQNRVVRWAMTLMSYDFDITYVNTTKFAKADWLSRVIQEYPKNEDDIVIAEVDMEDAVDDWNSEDVTPVLETHIRNASAEDKELTEIMDLVENNAWKFKPKSEVEKSWHHVKDRLKLIRNCLLLDDRVVVPKVLQAKVLQQLHEGHPGVVKMKHKARSFVYWKGLDSQIEKVVQNCCSCQENAKMPRVVPLKPWPVPEAVWKRVHVDFAGPVDGLWFLVVVDAKSKYAEVKLTRTISAVATVDLLDEVFSVHGYPELIVSDNGTQFTSQFFQDMCTSYGISHKTTAVYYPRSNGAAERFVDTLKRGIAKIRETGSVNQQLLNKFLINYRNSPHASLNGATPAEVHFNRKIRVKMSLLLPRERVEAASELTPYQDKMKSAYDKRNAARANSFQVGQSVYARVQHGNKFSWEYGEIRRRIGSVLYEVQVERSSRRQSDILGRLDETSECFPAMPDDDDDDYSGRRVVKPKPIAEKYAKHLGSEFATGKTFVTGSDNHQKDFYGSQQVRNDAMGSSGSSTPLTEDEKNKLSAKILKAEMKGDKDLVKKLKRKLESGVSGDDEPPKSKSKDVTMMRRRSDSDRHGEGSSRMRREYEKSQDLDSIIQVRLSESSLIADARTGILKGGAEVDLKRGSTVRLTTDILIREIGSSKTIYIDLPRLPVSLKNGSRVLIANNISLMVKRVELGDLICRVENGGMVGDNEPVWFEF
ncbi:hypothetical protein CAEBREN_24623 [Caenorhabditis brenneri]|uniref:RNA-directed DNA polymerase n=1 Tax=Caenorhabditis brenneri TaxID=135651 RepID=G0MCE6_CAEBE|nr:hypothetical protein CAEBREN_24623 [Caenorhabditis brenneri]